MRATFQSRQTLVQDQEKSSTDLDVFPCFLDIPGLIDQDFTMMFGEDATGRCQALRTFKLQSLPFATR
ncbi:unnamed protein product [Boreogadus saida]